MTFRSTKTFGHELGLSAAFRQWRADSHCRLIHGYALSIILTFEARYLDANNWVVDFGSLKTFKQLLVDTFDHKLLVATDDPEIEALRALGGRGLAHIVEVEATGCEAFAKLVYGYATRWLDDRHSLSEAARISVVSVEVREHGANSAIFIAP